MALVSLQLQLQQQLPNNPPEYDQLGEYEQQRQQQQQQQQHPQGQQLPPLVSTLAAQVGGLNPVYNQPSIIIPMMTHEQQMAYKRMLRQQQKDHLNRLLIKNFPLKWVIGHGLVLIVICTAMVALQIVLLVQNENLNGASGLWSGLIGIVFSIFNFILMKTKKYEIYMITNMFSIASLTVFGVTCVLNGLAINSAASRSDSTINPVHVVMIVLATFGFFWCLFYFITTNFFFSYRARLLNATRNGNELELNTLPNMHVFPPITQQTN